MRSTHPRSPTRPRSFARLKWSNQGRTSNATNSEVCPSCWARLAEIHLAHCGPTTSFPTHPQHGTCAKSARGWDVKEAQCRNAPLGFLARSNGIPCARGVGRARLPWGSWHAIGVARARPEGAWHGPMARANVLGRQGCNEYGARRGKQGRAT